MSARYKLFLTLAGSAAALLILDFLSAHGQHEAAQHAEYWWNAMPGFDLIFGLLGAALLTVFAKLILFPVVKRGEDYYKEDER